MSIYLLDQLKSLEGKKGRIFLPYNVFMLFPTLDGGLVVCTLQVPWEFSRHFSPVLFSEIATAIWSLILWWDLPSTRYAYSSWWEPLGSLRSAHLCPSLLGHSIVSSLYLPSLQFMFSMLKLLSFEQWCHDLIFYVPDLFTPLFLLLSFCFLLWQTLTLSPTSLLNFLCLLSIFNFQKLFLIEFLCSVCFFFRASFSFSRCNFSFSVSFAAPVNL